MYKDFTKYLAETRVSYRDFFTEAISEDEFFNVIYSGSLFTDKQANSMEEYLELSVDQFYNFFSVPAMAECRRGRLSLLKLPLYAMIPYAAIISSMYSCKEGHRTV